MKKPLVIASLLVFLFSFMGATLAQQKQPTTAAPAVGKSENQPTIVLLIRHAEKAKNGDDPPLNPAGKERAKTLARVAGKAKIDAIYTSEKKRTRQTAQELADYLKLPITQVPGADVDSLVKQITQDKPGKIVLVVGHSNTIPKIINKLGGGDIDPIEEYDNLFVLVVPRSGSGKLVQLKYGIPTLKK